MMPGDKASADRMTSDFGGRSFSSDINAREGGALAPEEYPLRGFPTPSGAGREAVEFFEPNLYLYDAYPGGIGFSEPLFRIHDLMLQRTRELILACPCESGCPSCVGPAGEKSERTKEAALAILEHLCA
jgi:DEAD/DEAH box helicase domain-containing protein